MMGLLALKGKQPQLLSVEQMLVDLSKVGSPTLCTVQGQWWCYLVVKKGAAELTIKGDRKDNASLFEAVADCYSKVKDLA